MKKEKENTLNGKLFDHHLHHFTLHLIYKCEHRQNSNSAKIMFELLSWEWKISVNPLNGLNGLWTNCFA